MAFNVELLKEYVELTGSPAHKKMVRKAERWLSDQKKNSYNLEHQESNRKKEHI